MAIELTIRVKDAKAAAAFRKFAKSANAQIDKVEKKAKSSGKTIGRSLGAGLAPLVGAAGALIAIKSLVGGLTSFESAMAEVSTLVDTSVTDIGALTKATLELSTKVPRSAIDISKGLYQTISAGVTDAADAMKLLEIATKSAVAGITDTNTAVDAITTVMNAYGKSVDDATNISDIFFTTIREGKTTFPELAQNIGTVVSSAALAGITFEELGAAFATTTKAGINTADTATALNRLFLSLANPTEGLKNKTKSMGIEFSAAALRAKGFQGFMEEIIPVLAENEDAIFELGLDIRAFKALAILGGTGAAEFTKQLENMGDVLGANQLAFEKMNATVEAQANILKNQLNKAWVDFGSKALPGATGALGFLNKVMSESNEIQKESLVPLGGIVEQQNSFTTAVITSILAALGFGETLEEVKNKTKEVNDEFNKLFRELEKDDKVFEKLFSDKGAGDLTKETLKQQFAWLKILEARGEISTLASTELIKHKQSSLEIEAQVQLVDELGQEIEISVGKFDNLASTAEVFNNSIAKSVQEMQGFVSLINQALNIIEGATRSGGGLFGTIIGAGAGFLLGGPSGAFAGAQAGGQIGGRIFGAHGFDFKVPGTDTGLDDKQVTVNVRGGERLIAIPPGEQLTSNGGNTFNLSFPSITRLDEFEVRTTIIPMINQLVQRGEVRLTATGLAV